MKAGYVALFSLVVAYSAYQGTSSLSPGSSQQLSGTSKDSKIAAGSALPAGLLEGAEPFPTISGGICPLSVNGVASRPCGNCKGICPAKELSELIEDYFRAEPERDQNYLATHWNVPQPEQAYMKFVIASLPDPVHTHMALLFDRGIETIQRAAQASGYLFSRAWMPWDISTHSESTDFTIRLAQAKLRDEMESLPGLMIFQSSTRQNGARANILFVFVVGETPTAGLRIAQFQNALNIRRAILGGAKIAGEVKALRIFGPTFSGSLASLNGILKAQRRHDQFDSILIRSGSVSSFSAAHDFCESTHKEWPEPNTDTNILPPPTGRPDFVIFQFSDEYQEFYLSRFFSKRQNLHSHVAILSEDETEFGNLEKPEAQPEKQSKDASAAVQQSPVSTDPCPAKPTKSSFGFLRLYFPREIAQLRDAYQRDVKEQTAPDGTKAPRQPGLPLSLSVTGNDDDSVATYSPLQTPLSQESILQSIVVSLRKNHAKVVIIRATDPLDVVFLSRYLRQNYPQARLVTMGLDLLMIRDLFDQRFQGILALAPYPLLNGVDFPKSSDGNDEELHRLFPDSYGVGEFDAFASLLAPNAGEAGTLLPTADYAQFGLPSFLEDKGSALPPWRAHLWLTAVGKEGYWPVAVLDDVDPASVPGGKLPERSIPAVSGGSKIVNPYSVHFSIGWTILSTVAFGLTLFLAFLLAYPHVFTRSEILGRFGGHPSVERNRLLFATGMLLLSVQTLFLFPMIIWLRPFGFVWQGWEDLFTGMEVATGGYAVSVLLLGLACYRGFIARGELLLARVGIVICSATTAISLVLTWWMWPGKLGTRLGAFVYRYIAIGSGVSPCLPILFLLAAWMWWCWQSLTGVGSTEEKDMVLPAASDFDRENKGDQKAPHEKLVPETSDRVRLKLLTNELNMPLWNALKTVPVGENGKIGASACLAFGLLFLWMRPDEIAEAFEVLPYKVIYWVLLYSCLLLLCYLVMHIVGLWLEFRNLLRVINRLPFRRGFVDLKSLTWKPLWKLAGSGRQEFVQLLAGELEALTQIENSRVSDSELLGAIKKAKDAEEKVSAEYERMLNSTANKDAPNELQRLFHELQKGLADTASKAFIYANKQWKNEPYAPAAEPDTRKDSDKSGVPVVPVSDPKTRAVEHFLCLFYVNVILVPLRRLQTLILAMAGVFVFVLLSYSSYPFESRESFHGLLISIFFAMSLVVGIVYGQMYANPLLSLITNTEPGELGLDFWLRLGSFVFIPLLSLVSVQFPGINDFLFSWLQPALQSIK